MAGNREQVGELHVKIVAEGAAQTAAAVQGVKREFDAAAASATKATNAVASGAAKAGDETDKAARKAMNFRNILSTIAWPAAVLFSAARMADLLDRMIHQSEDFRKRLEDIGEAFGERISGRILKSRSEFDRQQVAALQDQRSTLRQIDEEAKRQLDDRERQLRRLLALTQAGIAARQVLSKEDSDALFGVSDSEIIANAEKEKQRIVSDTEKLLAKIAKDRIAAEKEEELKAKMKVYEEEQKLLRQHEESRDRAEDERARRSKLMSDARRGLIKAEVKGELDAVDAVLKAKLDAIEKAHAAALQSIQGIQAAQGSAFNRTLEGIAANVSALKTTISLRSRSVN